MSLNPSSLKPETITIELSPRDTRDLRQSITVARSDERVITKFSNVTGSPDTTNQIVVILEQMATIMPDLIQHLTRCFQRGGVEYFHLLKPSTFRLKRGSWQDVLHALQGMPKDEVIPQPTPTKRQGSSWDARP